MLDAKIIIDLCSSDEEEEVCFVDENNCDYVDEEGLEESEEEDSSFSEDDSDWSRDDAADSDLESDEDYEMEEKADDDHKVTSLLTAGSNLKALNLKDCKAYLRKHGLRLSGTKAVCIERIVEHWRIKDGSGEAVYPRSSFAINCKGDVCKGDTVLFTQKVHQKSEKMKRSGKIMGKRTIAGHVIKESYGTAKQQHTFTIEVLWCVGSQKLPPLYPLLVKGRNLYRLMTLRQRWANEGDRVKVLSEKHCRGAAARKVMRERKIKMGYVLKDGRLQKPGHVKKHCQVSTRKNEIDENLNQRVRQDIPASHSLAAFRNQNPSQDPKNRAPLRNMNPPFQPHAYHSQAPRPCPPLTYAPPPREPLTYAPRSYGPFNLSHSHLPRPNAFPSHSYAYPTQQNQSNSRPPPAFDNRKPTYNALQGQVASNPHANTHNMPVTHHRRPYPNHHINHVNYGLRELDHFSSMMISQRPYKNNYTYPSNSSSGYSHGAREGDTHRPNYR